MLARWPLNLAIEKPKNLFLYLLISRPDLNLLPWCKPFNYRWLTTQPPLQPLAALMRYVAQYVKTRTYGNTLATWRKYYLRWMTRTFHTMVHKKGLNSVNRLWAHDLTRYVLFLSFSGSQISYSKNIYKLLRTAIIVLVLLRCGGWAPYATKFTAN